MRKVRTALAVLLLIVSLAVLAWGLWPSRHDRHILNISPAEMSLPTPSSFVPSLFGGG